MTKIDNCRSNVKLQDVKQEVSPKNSQINTVFKEDGTLSKSEKRQLRKNDGINLSRSEIKKYSAMEGGEAFLDKYANIAETIKDAAELKSARQKMVLNYFVGDGDYQDVSDDIKLNLNRFGVDSNMLYAHLSKNRLNHNRPMATISPDIKAGETTVQSIRIHQNVDKNGNITSLSLYEGEDGLNNEEAQPARTLIAEGEYFVEKGETPKYYKFNDNVLSNVTSDVATTKAADVPKPGTIVENEQPNEVPLKPKFDDVFGKNKTVNINETGSKQKLTRNEEWSTNLKIPKNTEYTEDGIPKKLAIELPSDYGAKGADGVVQKRYQVLSLIDADNNVYSDKAGIRQFQMEVTKDGIKLNLYNPDDKKIKDFLNKNTELAQEVALKNGLNDKQNKMQITAQEESKQIMTQLSNRNTSWETYTQIGTDVGKITGAHGLLEKLVDEQNVTNIKTFNDMKPAIEGLMARVPESVIGTPEYISVQEAIAKLSENPDANIKHSRIRQIAGDTDIRKLDRALMNLAKTHLAKSIQGANHANNEFLIGGNGSIVISPDKEKGIWNTDAKFNIGGQNYYLYQQRALINRTVDFQDVVEHKDDGSLNKLSLIRNEVTGNNRHGEIKFNTQRAEAETFFFKNDAIGTKLPVVVEDGVAYIQGRNEKVKVDDVLNGRAKMPE